MNVLTNKNKQGFTIIEVVLVLAIAALIFLMVFIALPALQRNQRDTARKTVLGKVASSVTSFQSNNKGKLPCIAAGVPLSSCTAAKATADVAALGKYLNADPDLTSWAGTTTNVGAIDGQYTLKSHNLATAFPTAASTEEDNIYYVPKATCGSDGIPVTSTSNRKAAIATILENGNFANYVCQEV